MPKFDKCLETNIWERLRYTISKSERTDPEGNKQLSGFDQTHNLNLVGSYQYERWTFSTRLRFTTGNPRTHVTGGVYDADNITTTAVSTDTSTTDNTAVTLTKDSQGGLYITKGSTNILIVDSDDAAVAFDWIDNLLG